MFRRQYRNLSHSDEDGSMGESPSSLEEYIEMELMKARSLRLSMPWSVSGVFGHLAMDSLGSSC